MDSPLKVAICDDSQDEKEKLLAIINNSPIKSDCDIFSSGEDFLNAFQPEKYDLILMDIFMTGINGIDTITKVREVDKDVPVAFITTSLDYTLESYRLSALKYIEKPFKQQDINDMFHIALTQRDSYPTLQIKKGTSYEKIRISNIVYLEQNSRQVLIHMSDGRVFDVYDKISNILLQINDSAFFHCHKSYAVNLAQTKTIDQDLRCFTTVLGENVPIRRNSLTTAVQLFEDYLFNSTKK